METIIWQLGLVVSSIVGKKHHGTPAVDKMWLFRGMKTACVVFLIVLYIHRGKRLFEVVPEVGWRLSSGLDYEDIFTMVTESKYIEGAEA